LTDASPDHGNHSAFGLKAHRQTPFRRKRTLFDNDSTAGLVPLLQAQPKTTGTLSRRSRRCNNRTNFWQSGERVRLRRVPCGNHSRTPRNTRPRGDPRPICYDFRFERRTQGRVVWATERRHQDAFLEYLEGWWFRRVITQLTRIKDGDRSSPPNLNRRCPTFASSSNKMHCLSLTTC